MASFAERIVGAMTLKASTYEEVERDASATGQAATIVIAAAISSGISFIWYLGFNGFIRNTIFALIGWVIGAAVVWAIGTKVLPGPNTQADVGQLMRTVGFAQSPGLLAFIGIVPILGWLVAIALWVWGLVAWVIAVKQALDYDDTMRAVIVCVLAWVAMVVVSMVLGGAAMMMGGRPGF